jgi:hypothetical protein
MSALRESTAGEVGPAVTWVICCVIRLGEHIARSQREVRPVPVACRSNPPVSALPK